MLQIIGTQPVFIILSLNYITTSAFIYLFYLTFSVWLKQMAISAVRHTLFKDTHFCIHSIQKTLCSEKTIPLEVKRKQVTRQTLFVLFSRMQTFGQKEKLCLQRHWNLLPKSLLLCDRVRGSLRDPCWKVAFQRGQTAQKPRLLEVCSGHG